MNIRLLKLAFAAAVAVSVPAVAAFANDAADASQGLTTAAQHAPADTVPLTVGKPDWAGQPGEDEPLVDEDTVEDTETDEDTDEDALAAGERPQNHGWFVSQAAKDHGTVGRAHGEAVSTVARGDAGKPSH
jgi:hypothetical protein